MRITLNPNQIIYYLRTQSTSLLQRKNKRKKL